MKIRTLLHNADFLRKSARKAVALLIVLAVCAGAAWGEDYATNTSSTPLDWNQAGSWTGNAVPTINGSKVATITLNSDVTVPSGTNLIFNNSGSQRVTVYLNGHTLTIADSIYIGVTNPGSEGNNHYDADVYFYGTGSVVANGIDTTNHHNINVYLNEGVSFTVKETYYGNLDTGKQFNFRSDGTSTLYIPASGANVNYGDNMIKYYLSGSEDTSFVKPFGEPKTYKITSSGNDPSTGITIKFERTGTTGTPDSSYRVVSVKGTWTFNNRTITEVDAGYNNTVQFPSTKTLKRTSSGADDSIVISFNTPDGTMELAEIRWVPSEIRWTGASSTAWNTSGNWSTNTVPVGDSKVIIPAGCSNYPVLDTDVSVGTVTIKTNAHVTQSAGNFTVNKLVTEGTGYFEQAASSTGTVTFKGTDASWQATYPDFSSFTNVAVSTGAKFTPSGDLYIAGNFTNEGGQFIGTDAAVYLQSGNHTITGNSDNAAYTKFHQFLCTNHGGKTITFNGKITADTISLSGTSTNSTLAVKGGSGAEIAATTVQSGYFLTIEGAAQTNPAPTVTGSIFYGYSSVSNPEDSELSTGWGLPENAYVWLGNSSSWGTATNWSTGLVPDDTDTEHEIGSLIIPATSPVAPGAPTTTFTVTDTIEIARQIDWSSYDMSVGNSCTLKFGDGSSPAVIKLNSLAASTTGTVTVSDNCTLMVTGNVSRTGTGASTVSGIIKSTGGDISLSSTTTVGSSGSFQTDAAGKKVTLGTVNVSTNWDISTFKTGSTIGTLNIRGNSTFTQGTNVTITTLNIGAAAASGITLTAGSNLSAVTINNNGTIVLAGKNLTASTAYNGFTSGSDTDAVNISGSVSISGTGVTGTYKIGQVRITDTATLSGTFSCEKFIATGLGGKTLTVNGTVTIGSGSRSDSLQVTGISSGSKLNVAGSGTFKLNVSQLGGRYLTVSGPVVKDQSGGTTVTYSAAYSAWKSGTTSVTGWNPSSGELAKIWTGGANTTTWETAGNWQNGVPTSTDDVHIQTSTNNKYPVLSSNLTVKSITINSGTTLDAASCSITCGSFTNNGTFRVSDSIELDASSSTFGDDSTVEYYSSSEASINEISGAGKPTSYGNLIIGSTVTLTASGGLTVKGTLTNGKTLNAGGALTVTGATTNNGTISAAGDVQFSSYTGSGDVISISGGTTSDPLEISATSAMTVSSLKITGDTVFKTFGDITISSVSVASGKKLTLDGALSTGTLTNDGQIISNGKNITCVYAKSTGVTTDSMTLSGNVTLSLGTGSAAIGAISYSGGGTLTSAGTAGISTPTLTITGSAGDTTLSGAMTLGKLVATGLGGKSLTINGALTIGTGATGTAATQTLQLTGSSSSSKLTVGGTGSITLNAPQVGGKWLTVGTGPSISVTGGGVYAATYSTATGTAPTGWYLCAEDLIYIWQGGSGSTTATKTAWGTAANWNVNIVPSSDSAVRIADTTNDPVTSGNISLSSLSLDSGAELTLGGTLTLSGSLTNSGTLTLGGAVSVGGQLSNSGTIVESSYDLSFASYTGSGTISVTTGMPSTTAGTDQTIGTIIFNENKTLVNHSNIAFTNITVESGVQLELGTSETISGTLTNKGKIKTGNKSISAGSYTNGGANDEVDVSSSGGNVTITGSTASTIGKVTLEANGTVANSGSAALTVSALVVTDTATLTTSNTGTGSISYGAVTVASGKTLTTSGALSATSLTNSGTVTQGADITLSGALTNNGTVNESSHALKFGSYSGTGTISVTTGMPSTTATSDQTIANIIFNANKTLESPAHLKFTNITVESGTFTVNDALTITGAFVNKGTLSTSAALSAASLTNSGTVTLGGNLTLSGVLTNTSTITAGGNTIQAASYSKGSGTSDEVKFTAAGGTFKVTGSTASTVSKITLEANGTVANSGSAALAVSNLNINGDVSLTTSKTGTGSISYGTAVVQGSKTLTLTGDLTIGGLLTNNGTIIEAAHALKFGSYTGVGTVSVTTGMPATTATSEQTIGTIIFNADMSLGTLTNLAFSNVTVASGKTLTLGTGLSLTGALTNNGTVIESSYGLQFGSYTGSGTISVTTGMPATTAGTDQTIANIIFNADNTLGSPTHLKFTNITVESGTFTVNDALTITGAFVNKGTLSTSAALSAASLTNSGTVTLGGNLTLSGVLTNTSTITAGGNTIQAASYSKGSGTSDEVKFTAAGGTFEVTGSTASTVSKITLGATGTISNTGSGTLTLPLINVTADAGLTTSGTGEIEIDKLTVAATKKLTANSNLTVQELLTNNGTIISTGHNLECIYAGASDGSDVLELSGSVMLELYPEGSGSAVVGTISHAGNGTLTVNAAIEADTLALTGTAGAVTLAGTGAITATTVTVACNTTVSSGVSLTADEFKTTGDGGNITIASGATVNAKKFAVTSMGGKTLTINGTLVVGTGVTGDASKQTLQLTGTSDSSLLTVAGSGLIKLNESQKGGRYLTVTGPEIHDLSDGTTVTYTATYSTGSTITGWYILADGFVYKWTGAAGTDVWSTAGNWNGSEVPSGSADDILIATDSGKSNPVLPASLSAQSLEIAAGISLNAGTSAISVGTLTVAGQLTSGNSTGGGSVSATTFAVSGSIIANGGTTPTAITGSGSIATLTLNGNTTLSNSSATALTVTSCSAADSLTLTTAGTGTVSFGAFTVSSGKTLTLGGDLTVTGLLTNGGTIDVSSHSLSTGTFTQSNPDSGTVKVTSGTISAGTAGQTVYKVIFEEDRTFSGFNNFNLKYVDVSDGVTLTFAAPMTFSGTLRNDGTIIESGYGLSFLNYAGTGTISVTTGIISTTSTSDVTVGKLIVAGDRTHQTVNHLVFADVTVNSGVTLTAGDALSFSGTLENNGTVVLDGKNLTTAKFAGNGGYNVSGAVTLSSTGANALASGTVALVTVADDATFTRSGNYTLTQITVPSGKTLTTSGALTAVALSNGGTVTQGDDVTVTGALTNAGTITEANHALSFGSYSGSGTVSVTTGAISTTAGTLQTVDKLVVAGDRSHGSTNNIAFTNITIENGKTLTTTAPLTLTGTLTNRGTLRTGTRSVQAAAYVSGSSSDEINISAAGGSFKITGDAATTLRKITLNANGTVANSGSGALTVTLVEVTGDGSLATSNTGAGTITLTEVSVNSGKTLTVSSSLEAGTVTNNGNIALTSSLEADSITNNGTIAIAGGTLKWTTAYTGSSDTVTASGNVTVNGSGTGAIGTFSVIDTATVSGTFSCRKFSALSLGGKTLTINGTVSVGSGTAGTEATQTLVLTGTSESSRLAVTGTGIIKLNATQTNGNYLDISMTSAPEIHDLSDGTTVQYTARHSTGPYPFPVGWIITEGDMIFIWTGSAGTTDWATAGNWSAGDVPDGTGDVKITEGTLNPVISGGAVTVASLQLGSGKSLTVNSGLTVSGSFTNGGTVTQGADIIIGGLLTNNGTIDEASYALTFGSYSGTGSLSVTTGTPATTAATDQTIAGITFASDRTLESMPHIKFADATLAANKTLTLDSDFSITGTLTNSGTINAGANAISAGTYAGVSAGTDRIVFTTGSISLSGTAASVGVIDIAETRSLSPFTNVDFNNVVIASGKTVTPAGALTIAGTLTNNGTVVLAGKNLTAAKFAGLGGYDVSGTVTLASTGADAAASGTAASVTVSGDAAFTKSGSYAITVLTVSSGKTLTLSSDLEALTINNNGIIVLSGSGLSWTSAYNGFTGDSATDMVKASGNVTVNGAGTGTISCFTVTDTAAVSGTFSCGKFAATDLGGKTLTINGTITVGSGTTGTAAVQTLRLSGTSDDSRLTVSGTGAIKLNADQIGGQYLAVTASTGPAVYDLTGGTTVLFTATHSTGPAIFPTGWNILIGDLASVWIGAVNSLWTEAGNWQGGNTPDDGADININAVLSGRTYPVLTENITANAITIASGAKLDAASYTITCSTLGNSGTFRISTGSVNGTASNAAGSLVEYYSEGSSVTRNEVSGAGESISVLEGVTLTLTGNDSFKDVKVASGAQIRAGESSSSSYQLTVSGNFINQAGSNGFVPQKGNVIIEGEGAHNIKGSCTFYNFTCVTPGARLYFDAGSTLKIEKMFKAEGSATQYVVLDVDPASGSVNEGRWNIDLPYDGTGTAPVIRYVRICNSKSISAMLKAVLDHCTDGGNNQNWFDDLPEILMTLAPVGGQQLFVMFSTPVDTTSESSLRTALSVVDGTTNLVNTAVPVKVYSSGADTALVYSLTRNLTWNDLFNLRVEIVSPAVKIDGTSIPYLVGTKHTVSDFAVNAARMLFGYDNYMDPDVPLTIQNGTNSVRSWDGGDASGNKLHAESDLLFQAEFDAGVPSDKRLVMVAQLASHLNPAAIGNTFAYNTGLTTRFWLPESFEPLSTTAQSVPAGQLISQDTTSAGRLRNFSIHFGASSANPLFALPAGDEIQFLFKVQNADQTDVLIDRDCDGTPESSLYVIRLKDANDITTADVWSVSLEDISRQVGSVTILNNVINSDKKEQTRVEVQLQKAGNLTVQVLTLDGDLVTTLQRGRKNAGTYGYSWDGSNGKGRPVARGMYFIRVIGPDIDETRKVMVVRD